MNDATQSITLKTITSTALAELSEFGTALAEFRERYDGQVYDLSDRAIERQARSDRAAVSAVIGRLDKRHKQVKEPLLEASRAVDGRRRDIKKELESIRDGIADQIKAHEQIEIDRKAALAARVQAIRCMAIVADMTAEQIAERRQVAADIVLDDSWQEFVADAQIARDESIKMLDHALTVAREHEAERAELARLRAEADKREAEAEQERAEQAIRERDERIAREAAETARRDAEAEKRRAVEAARIEVEAAAKAAHAAETARLAAIVEAEHRERETAKRAERDAAAAAAKAEADRIAAVEAERARAERAAAEERARVEAERRGAEMAAAAAKREDDARRAKAEHRHRIHVEAMAGFVRAGIDEDAARDVLNCIRSGDVPHVTITY